MSHYHCHGSWRGRKREREKEREREGIETSDKHVSGHIALTADSVDHPQRNSFQTLAKSYM